MDRARRRTDRKELPGAGFVPEGNRLAVHFLESVTSISKIQDAIVKEFRATLGMLFREFSKPSVGVPPEVGKKLQLRVNAEQRTGRWGLRTEVAHETVPGADLDMTGGAVSAVHEH